MMMNNNKTSIAAVITALLAIGMMMPGSSVDKYVVNAAQQATCGNLPVGTSAQDGAACTDALTGGQATVGCGGESYTDTVRTETICTCAAADPIWKCVSTDTDIPANNPCPAQDSSPISGDSCDGLLVIPDSSQTCMFSRKFSSSSDLETFNCVCSNAAGSTVNLWSCDGSFAPAVAPTYMPAGQVQPSTTIPVPTAPTTPMVCGTFPGDGTTCAGVLPVGLSSASCNYSQTITTNGVPLDEAATCECDASTEIWNCVGSYTTTPIISKDADEDTTAIDEMDVTDETTTTTTTTTSASDDSGATSFIQIQVMATLFVATVAIAATTF